MFDLLDRLKRWFIDLVKSRVFVLMLVFIVLSTILIQRVFVLQIVNGQAYLDDYKLQIQKTKQKRYREPEVVSWTGTEWFWQITSSHIPSRLKTTVTMIRLKRKIK